MRSCGFISLVLVALANSALAQPLTTAFTFQGRLDNGGVAASGLYDLRFRVYDAPTGGTQQGPTLCTDNVAALAGTLTTQLDFGAQFAGQRRWLEIDVRHDTGLDCTNSTGFTTLSPRQELTATPNASFAGLASSAFSAVTANTATSATTATNATQLNNQPASFYQNAANLSSGTIPSARLTGPYTNALSLSNASNTFTGSFTGSGAGLNSVPFSSLTGVPPTVSLQPTTPGLAQVGSLNLTGEGLFAGLAIGTTAPAALLHIVDPTLGTLRVDRASGSQFLVQSASTFTRIGTNSASPLRFITGGNDQMTLDASGRLGIGTTTPETDLHIQRASAGTITANVNAPLVVENNSNTYVNIFAPDANETGILFGRPGSTVPSAAGGILYNSGGNADGLQLRTGGNVTRMTIDSGGNVGIGVTNPTAKLQVAGPAGDSTVILPNSSIGSAEIADEPGIACDIENAGDVYSPFSTLHVAATRTITAPADGFVLAIGTVSIWGDISQDSSLIIGLSTSSSSLLNSNKQRLSVLSQKIDTVTLQGLFPITSGASKTISFLLSPDQTGHTLLSGNAHLTLIFFTTSYGTIDIDQ